MLKIIKLSIFLFFIFSQHLFADVISKITVEGNKRITKETIIVYGGIDKSKEMTREILDNITKNLYETNFFQDIELSFNNNELNIKVVEHPVINQISISGEKVEKYKEIIFEKISSKQKGSFIKSQILKDTQLIKSLYQDLGFSFANVDAKFENVTKDIVNLTFFIERGDKLKISEINFIGEKKIKDRRLRDIIVSQEYKFWKFLTKSIYFNQRLIDLDKRLLKNYYRSAGYYDVQVTSSFAEIKEENVVLTYNINAGNRYRVSKISTNVDPVLDNKPFLSLEKEFKKAIGEYYSPFKIKKILDRIDAIIFENELQFVEHSVKETVVNDNIEVVLNIFEGKKNLVQEINVTGNNITKEHVIRSALLLDEGDPFNELKLNRSISNLKSKNLFSQVNYIVKDGSLDGTKIIEIDVEEKPTGEIMAGAGVGTDGSTIAFSISENNWMGNGIKLSTNVEVSDNSLKGSFNVRNPDFNYSGNVLNFGLASTKIDKSDSGYENTTTNLFLGTEFEQYKDIYFTPQISFAVNKLTVDDSASNLLKKQEGSFNEIFFDYGFIQDKRDRTFMPTSGYIASFGQGLPLYADSPSILNKIAVSKYNSFSENFIGAVKFYGAARTGLGEDVRLNHRLSIPGSRLRGFETGRVGPKDGEDFIGGNYVTALNFEGSLPNLLPESTKTDVSLFLDFGNVWGVDYDSAIDDSNKIRSSTGINTSWLSPLGPMTFTFSQNLTKASSDVTQSFKFNIGTTF